MKYLITVKKGNKNITKEIENRTLKDALHNLLKQCIDENDNEIFFELKNANLEQLKNNKKFHIINKYGIVLENVECIDNTKPDYANEFRAKREMFGYSLPELANELEISEMTIKRIEKGKSNLYNTFLKMKKIF